MTYRMQIDKETTMPHQMILGFHPLSPAHLAKVEADMRTLGAPTIPVYDCGEYYLALQGNHRLGAACALGLPVTVQVLSDDDEIDHDCEDVDSRKVGDLVAYLTDSPDWPMHAPVYKPVFVVTSAQR